MNESGSISEPVGCDRPSRPRYVLIVCYNYPGIWADGVIRTYQFAKRLPCFGWQPIILTSQPWAENREDDIETADGALNCLRITVPRSRFLVPYQTDHDVLREPLDGIAPKANGIFAPVAEFVRQLPIPDGKIAWLPAAVKGGLRIARDYPVEMCFSVSPRPTAHLVARRLAQSLGIAWVADFALPWSDAYWLTYRPRVMGWLDQRLQGSVLDSAQHVTVAYPDIGRGICGRYGASWGRKISVIPTGFDEDLFRGGRAGRRSKFTIVYPGHHFCEEGRHGASFLRAVDEWVGSGRGLEDRVEFVFMGKRDDGLLRGRAAMAHAKAIRLEPLRSHKACVEAILSSDACVVNAVGNRVPAKVYECMRAGKWVLALTDPGTDLENLIRRYARGISVPPRDGPGIGNALQRLFEQRDSEVAEPSEVDPSLAACSSRHGAESLARIFEAVAASRGGGALPFPHAQ